MKQTIFKITAAFCISLAFAFSYVLLSCDGITQNIDWGGHDTEAEQEFIISGTLSVDGAVPSEVARSVFSGSTSLDSELSARTAIPSIPSSTTYTVTATSGSKTVEGEVNGNSFTIKLSSGTWTVKAEGSDSAKKILEGQTQSPVNISPNTVANNISITLSPISSGSGSIDLTVNFDGTTGINSVEMILTKVGSNPQTITGSGSTGNQRKLTRENIESGVYNAEINFKSSSDELKYSTHETVNVFSNLTTNTWQGNSPYLTGTGTNKKFEITQNLVNTSKRKEFYVQGTGGTHNPPTNASDTNSGTYFDPFATLQKAVDTINAINDETSTYKIIVDGTLEITTPASESDNSGVIIKPDKILNLTIESLSTAKATIKANSSDMRVFKIGEFASKTSNVTMKNLIITDGKLGTSGQGGGIYVNDGTLTLSNVEVINNFAYTSGGGIFFGGEKLTINEGSKISNNTVGTWGGGIYVEQGSLEITNSEISENEASYGGGIYVKESNTIKISGTDKNPTKILNNTLTYSPLQNKTGTAIHVCYGAKAELSGNVTITSDNTQSSAIYLERGGGLVNVTPDAVLKLGGNIQIGNGNGTGIKIEGKVDKTKTNIKITAELTSTQTINISYDDAESGEPIIEGENYTLTKDDCKKFSFDNSAFSLRVWPGNKGMLF